MASSHFDMNRKFVRVINTLPNGLVEFEFAIGDADVAVELIMPKAAFDEFCRDNHVEFTETAPAVRDAESADFSWNLQQATHQRFR